MCGIAGIKLFNREASKTDADLLQTALKLQFHRGPDNTNVWTGHRTILGHNRLAIIDTNERSHQPFTDESGRYSLVYNGEIYNYQELKNVLLSKGYIFNTSSDTEVLFYHLIENGATGLETLRGCFAFAFYDQQTDYMLLARDRMGINPLLFSIQDDRLIFGSELPIFKALGTSQTISQKALNFYFQYTYIPAPLTIVEEVQKLLPGHYLEVKGKNYDIVPYWKPEADKPFAGTYSEGKSILREKTEFAVISQLEADVPVGTFLSGGVDSSIVSAIASQFKNELHTFSVSFKDEQAYDESAYALMVAKHIQSQHHVIELDENEFAANFGAILDSFDEPFADSSAIAMFFLAKETAKHLRVALSGDGADELFAGYNKHVAFEKAKNLSAFKKGALKLAAGVGGGVLEKVNPKKSHKLEKFNELSNQSWPESYWYLASNIGKTVKNSILKNPLSLENPVESKGDTLNDFLLLDQKFVLPGDMLKKVDLMSMRHSLEVRTPFMDKDLVRLANSFPANWKLQGSNGKVILKETFADLLPSEIFSRSKQGFEVPVHKWIRGRWNEIIPKIWFDSDYLENQGIFHFSAIQQLEKDFLANIKTSSQTIWAYLVFQHWFQKNTTND